jgi:hypothetical protein
MGFLRSGLDCELRPVRKVKLRTVLLLLVGSDVKHSINGEGTPTTDLVEKDRCCAVEIWDHAGRRLSPTRSVPEWPKDVGCKDAAVCKAFCLIYATKMHWIERYNCSRHQWIFAILEIKQTPKQLDLRVKLGPDEYSCSHIATEKCKKQMQKCRNDTCSPTGPTHKL